VGVQPVSWTHKTGKENKSMINELNAILEISKICKENNIKATIDESGIVLSAMKNGEEITKRFDLDEINIISMNLPLIVLFDLFIEDAVLKYNRA
jgi:hypothetical protein